MAVLDVPPQVLSRNVTYGGSFFGSMVSILDVSVQGLWRVVTFCADRQVFKFVYIVYFFPAFSQRMYDMPQKIDSLSINDFATKVPYPIKHSKSFIVILLTDK